MNTNSSCLNGICYNLSDFAASYKDAMQICAEYSGELVIVNSKDIQSFLVEIIRKSSSNSEMLEHAYEFINKFLDLWLQFFAVHLQLTIIIGLCMDDGNSLTSKFLRTNGMQFLGRIALSLYLIHRSVMGFTSLAINGPRLKEYFNTGIHEAYDEDKIFLPLGTPLIVMIVSPIVSFIVTKYFEEPITKILRGIN